MIKTGRDMSLKEREVAHEVKRSKNAWFQKRAREAMWRVRGSERHPERKSRSPTS